MTKQYKTIGLIGKPNHEGTSATIKVLHDYLVDNEYQVIIESARLPNLLL